MGSSFTGGADESSEGRSRLSRPLLLRGRAAKGRSGAAWVVAEGKERGKSSAAEGGREEGDARGGPGVGRVGGAVPGTQCDAPVQCVRAPPAGRARRRPGPRRSAAPHCAALPHDSTICEGGGQDAALRLA